MLNVPVSASSLYWGGVLRSYIGALEYEIYHADMGQAEIWSLCEETLERKYMSMYLPSGVSIEQFVQQWHSLDYRKRDSGSAARSPFGEELDRSTEISSSAPAEVAEVITTEVAEQESSVKAVTAEEKEEALEVLEDPIKSLPRGAQKLVPAGNAVLALRRMARRRRELSLAQAGNAEVVKVAWGESMDEFDAADSIGHFISQESVKSQSNAFKDSDPFRD